MDWINLNYDGGILYAKTASQSCSIKGANELF
jgi:hypothetical protein